MVKEDLFAEEDFILELTGTICKLLNDSGMTQRQLAIKTGYSVKYITKCLGGAITPRAFARMVNAFNLRPKINLEKLV